MPVLIYGGRGRWTAPTRLEELLPAANAPWLATQPRFEYLLLEERREGTKLPKDNLVGQFVAVARARGREEMVGAVGALGEWVAGEDGDEGGALDRAVAEWLKDVITDLNAALGPELDAATTTREVMEVIKPTGKWAVRWYEDGLDEGRAEGIEQGVDRQLRLLRRLVVRKFGDDAAGRLAEGRSRLRDPEVVEAVFAAAIDCDEAGDFLAQIADGGTSVVAPPEG